MADITLSSAVRNNLLSLQNTADLMGETQQRLATGKAVNSALDDPTAFFTAESLNSRASDLNRLLDSVGNAQQTLQAADEGISSITNLVESAQATARQASQSAASVAQAAEIVGTGSTLLNTTDVEATLTGEGADLAADVAAVGTGTGSFDGTEALSGDLGIATGDTITFQVDGETVDVDFGAGGGDVSVDASTSDLDALITAVNGQFTNDPLSLQGGGIQIQGTDTGEDIVIDDGGDGVLANLNLDGVGSEGATVNERVIEPTNSDLGALEGETLTVTVGTATSEIAFGTDDGTDEVNTRTELEARLTAISGSNGIDTASIDADGNLSVTADNVNDSISVTGSNEAAVTTFGLTDGQTADPTVNLLNNGFAQDETLTISIGDQTNTITFGTDDANGEVNTSDELETALGEITGGTASLDDSGNLTVTAGNTDATITLGGSGDETLFGVDAEATAEPTTQANPEREEYREQFNTIRQQINELAADAGFNGINLLQGDDLSVVFNEDGSSKLDIESVSFDSAGLGISEVAEGGFNADIDVETTLDELDAAVTTLRSQASTFGSNLSIVETRQDFTNNMINTLETGAGNLTLADTNEEGANMLALQTRQQLASTSLSLASQADRNVLQLF